MSLITEVQPDDFPMPFSDGKPDFIKWYQLFEKSIIATLNKYNFILWEIHRYITGETRSPSLRLCRPSGDMKVSPWRSQIMEITPGDCIVGICQAWVLLGQQYGCWLPFDAAEIDDKIVLLESQSAIQKFQSTREVWQDIVGDNRLVFMTDDNKYGLRPLALEILTEAILEKE